MSERREILFRGQTRRKGEKVRISGEPVDSNWVYGGIFPGEGDFSIIYQTKPEIEKFTVYSDTVGQYTGLTDKNGTRIFEKDIVACRQDESTGISIIIFEHGAFYVMPERGNIYERTLWDYWYNDWDIEVIGNIYDNPELLKGE